ncbi:UNVERIFIED_ORG: hypothetical protein ABIC48_003232 [Burkholderia territorii]
MHALRDTDVYGINVAFFEILTFDMFETLNVMADEDAGEFSSGDVLHAEFQGAICNCHVLCDEFMADT